MADIPEIADKRLKNLRPWKKGQAPRPKHPGRPRTADFAAAFREFMDRPDRIKQLFDTLRKKKSETAMYYLAGKPLERTVTVAVESSIDQLAKAVVRLEKQGGTNLPAPTEKTPPEST